MEVKHGGCIKCGTKEVPILFSYQCAGAYCPACFPRPAELGN